MPPQSSPGRMDPSMRSDLEAFVLREVATLIHAYCIPLAQQLEDQENLSFAVPMALRGGLSFIMLARGASEVVYCTQSAGRGNAPVHRVRTFALQHFVASRCEAPVKCRGPVERQTSHPSGKILWTTVPLLSHAHTKRHRSIECRTKNTEFDVCFLPTRPS